MNFYSLATLVQELVQLYCMTVDDMNDLTVTMMKTAVTRYYDRFLIVSESLTS